MKNILNCNEKTTTPSLYNNVKQGTNIVNIYYLNGWKDQINVNDYDDIEKILKTNFIKKKPCALE